MRIALAQIPVVADVASNVETLERAIDFAATNNADILLTPEGSLSGYTHQFATQTVEVALRDITAKAKAVRLGLALGTCFVENDRRCYNQIRFYDRGGTYLGFHSKTLTCGSLESSPRGEIEHYAVAPLSTYELDGVRVGGLICNDLWANPGCTPQPDPHLSQQLAHMGARVIFHAVNGGRSGGEWSQVAWQYHESNLRMRAHAGAVYIATVDNSFPADIDCSSPTGVLDPQGNWLCRSQPRGEQFLSFDIAI